MKHAWRVVLSAFALASLASQGAFGAGFLVERPWLAERSAWSETAGPGGGLRGWWAVGNSRVFGIVGANLPNAMIHQITGPHIMLAGLMNNGSAFGPTTLNLSVGGKPVQFTQQTLSKVRGTNIVVMELASPDVTMTVLNYAPFDVNALLRTVVVTNTSNTDLADVVLTATINRTTLRDGRLYNSFKGGTGGNAMGQTRQLFSAFLEPHQAAGPEENPGQGTLTTKIGALAAGSEAVRTQYLVFSMVEVGDEAATLARVNKEGVGLLRKTYDDWQRWLASTTRLECPDQRLIDLLDDNKMLVKIQTAEPQYAAGPMEFFAGVWVRDSNGPFLYYLRMGDLEAAKKMLEFYYRGTAYSKYVSNNKPMDIDMTQPIDPDLDWSTVHTDPVETPCWLILQHAWYFNYTGDLEPIRQHWGYLKRCLYGQIIDEKGEPFHTDNYGSREPGPNAMYRFPHHGDETWIYPGFEVLNSQVFPEPNDHPHWDSYSADSTWEFVMSAEVLADFAGRLGDAEAAKDLDRIAKESRAACERDYWMAERGLYGPAMSMRSLDVHQPPFAMVNFNPLWIGYLEPDDPKAVSNVVKTMKYTMNPNYVTDATETLRVYVGMQPGMFLYNLAAIDHPFGEPALKAMMEVASPSGEYTEKHVTDPNSYESGFRGHRIRPWEGGINMDAAYYYLTGLAPDVGNNRIALCPRLPFGWKEMSVVGQRIADGTLDVVVKDDGSARTYTVKWSGSKPITADFKISLPQAKITSVKADGRPVTVTPQSKWGLTTAKLEVPLAPRQATVISVAYEKQAAAPVKFARERYAYIVPEKVPSYEVVLWDNEPRKRNNADLLTYDHLKGKVKFRLICAYNPSDPTWLRPFLLKADGTINTPLFFMGAGSVSSSLKYAKWWGNPELTELFTDYMEGGGTIVALRTGETTSEFFGKLLGDSGYFTVPLDSSTVVPTEGEGVRVFGLLGLVDADKKLQARSAYVYEKMVVLAHPETEKSAASIVARQVGKGCFVTMLLDLDYEQTAALIENLADPQKVSELKRTVAASTPASVPGAFKDFSKNNAFSDDFGSYADGSIGLPVWLPLRGKWKMEAGEYHQLVTNGYDFLSTANARIKGDYVIEARVKLVQGIMEAGFVFNMPSRFTKGPSQMVRFCGHEAFWCGPFNSGGGFSLEHSVQTGVARDEEWHTFKVTVRNSTGTYDVAADGKTVAQGLKITNLAPDRGSYIGLVACRGHVTYDSVKVTPLGK